MALTKYSENNLKFINLETVPKIVDVFSSNLNWGNCIQGNVIEFYEIFKNVKFLNGDIKNRSASLNS